MAVFTATELTSAIYASALHDPQGHAVSGDVLGTATLTLYEEISGATINGRDNQNVLNANQVSFGMKTAITTSASGSPGVFQTAAPHGLIDQQIVTIENHAGSVPSVSGSYIVDVVGTTSFSLSKTGTGIPVNLTTGGSGGDVIGGMLWNLQPVDNTIVQTDKLVERHIALFAMTWTDTGGNPQRVEHQVVIVVRNLNKVP